MTLTSGSCKKTLRGGTDMLKLHHLGSPGDFKHYIFSNSNTLIWFEIFKKSVLTHSPICPLTSHQKSLQLLIAFVLLQGFQKYIEKQIEFYFILLNLFTQIISIPSVLCFVSRNWILADFLHMCTEGIFTYFL